MENIVFAAVPSINKLMQFGEKRKNYKRIRTKRERVAITNVKKSAVLSRIKKFSKSSAPPYIVLFLLIASYVTFFSVLSVDRQNRFDSLAFDLGIFDQAIWQFSKFETPFNTVRGIHIFGDHFTPINTIISPLYWFIDDVRALLILQSIVLAAAAIPLFLIGKHYFKNKWIPLVFCCAYLLFPAVQYVNLEDYHPEAFIPLFLLSAFYCILKGKKWHYYAFFVLALLTREETALTTFLLGIYIYFKFDKKTGVFTSIISLIWFLLALKLFIPFFNEGAYWHTTRVFGEFGNTTQEILLHLLNPSFVFSKVFTPANATFVWELFAPVGFLALLNPATLIISAYLWVDLIAAWPYSHSIHYHYVLPIVPFIFISLVLGVARFKNRKRMLYPLLAFLMLSTLVSNYQIAPFASSMKNYQVVHDKLGNFNTPSKSEQQAYAMLAMIPNNASVTASYQLVPHLTHRKVIYNFPNPFKEHYWGDGSKPPPRDYPDYIFLRKAHVEEFKGMLQPLLQNGTYALLRQSADFSLFARVE